MMEQTTNKFIPTKKYINFCALSLKPDTNLLVLEGTIRSSKTETAKLMFFYNVISSKEELHLISATDLDAIKDNLLLGEHGLLEMFSGYLTMARDEIGSHYLKVKNIPGCTQNKRILLAGYSDASKWKKILGKTLGVILVDEVNTANKQFIDECFARQTSSIKPLQIWTLNGDVPTHWVYLEYINRAKPIGKVPASILAEMNSYAKEDGWYYSHWRMQDNPIMTPEKIDKAKRIYKQGSYYFITKILGERGSPGKMIYVDYLDYNCIMPLDVNKFAYFGIGIDIGASRAQNSFALLGFSKDYKYVGIIDLHMFQQIGYDEKKRKLEAFVRSWKQKVPIEYISVDSAEANLIVDLRNEYIRKGLPTIIASYKATIKQRIDTEVILLSANRLLFNETEAGKKAYEAFQIAKWSDKKLGEEREDNNEWHNDVLDSIEYAFTRHMQKILKVGN